MHKHPSSGSCGDTEETVLRRMREASPDLETPVVHLGASLHVGTYQSMQNPYPTKRAIPAAASRTPSPSLVLVFVKLDVVMVAQDVVGKGSASHRTSLIPM
eukprot:391786-Amphidinium_carterae.2